MLPTASSISPESIHISNSKEPLSQHPNPAQQRNHCTAEWAIPLPSYMIPTETTTSPDTHDNTHNAHHQTSQQQRTTPLAKQQHFHFKNHFYLKNDDSDNPILGNWAVSPIPIHTPTTITVTDTQIHENPENTIL